MVENPYHEEYNVQSALQQQQIQQQQGLQAPLIFQDRQQVQATLVEQTNPIHVVEDVRMKLMGFWQKPNGKYERLTDPIMNNFGIGRMLFYLSCVVNQNTILSHLQTEEIGKLIIKLSDDIVDDLVLSWKEYGIKDKIMLDHITNAVLFPAFMALKRAWSQNEKNWLNKIVVESISTGTPRYMPEKKEGWLSKFKM